MRLNAFNFRKISLQSKIFAAITLLVIVACISIIAAVKNLLPPALIEASKGMGVLTAQRLAERSLDDILTDDYGEIHRRINEEKERDENFEYIFMMDDSFDVIAHSFSGGFPLALKDAHAVEAHQDSAIRILDTGLGRIYDIAVPVKLNGDTLGYVRVGLSDKHIHELSDSTIGAILWIGISTVLLASYLSFLLAGGIVRPVETMHRISEDIMMGDFSGQIKTPPVPCAELKNCDKKDCPAYAENHLPCWCVSGTLCEPVIGKDYSQKIEYCRTCPVYKKYSGDAVQQLAETFNLLSHGLNEKFNELRESAEMHRLLFEVSGEAIMTLESPSWKFTSGNPSAIKLFGVEDEKMFISYAPWEYSPEYQPDGQLSMDKAKKMINKALKEGYNFFEWTHKKLNGPDFYATVSLTRAIVGERIFLQAVVKDITERRKALDALKDKEKKLRYALEVKSRFSAMVSHEMRTPLAAIKESLNLISAGVELTAEQKQLMRIAARNANRLHRLISDVLEFSQLEAGRIKFNFSKNSLYKALEDAEASYKSAYAAKGIYLKTDFSGDLGDFIYDYDKIIEVVLNLLGNALKSTAEGGVVLSASGFSEGGKQMARVSVKDSGCGLRKKDFEVIFDQYVKQPGGSYNKPGGTGLGLSISKEIVLAHGGWIWAESAGQGKGTEIIFTLPKSGPVG
ncbi:MAG: PAS domain S-box protein, partial [Candidatus Omnitrophica bacterium]|nr:PAS domain S-box protein [Candidatus Omnitrophota bacterium]